MIEGVVDEVLDVLPGLAGDGGRGDDAHPAVGHALQEQTGDSAGVLLAGVVAVAVDDHVRVVVGGAPVGAVRGAAAVGARDARQAEGGEGVGAGLALGDVDRAVVAGLLQAVEAVQRQQAVRVADLPPAGRGAKGSKLLAAVRLVDPHHGHERALAGGVGVLPESAEGAARHAPHGGVCRVVDRRVGAPLLRRLRRVCGPFPFVRQAAVGTADVSGAGGGGAVTLADL
ncbi:MAG: hypothetical protein ACFCVE_15420 [Phycisphaerae bacterium]